MKRRESDNVLAHGGSSLSKLRSRMNQIIKIVLAFHMYGLEYLYLARLFLLILCISCVYFLKLDSKF